MDDFDKNVLLLDNEVNNEIGKNEVFTKRKMHFYVHIPFCKSVCVSCPYKKKVPTRKAMNEYLQSIKKEISMYAKLPHIKAAEFTGGHIGGGTPTSFDEDQLVDLLQHLKKELNLSKDIEIAIETTPVDIDESKVKKLVENGINRISIGVQSFYDDELTAIGRHYKRADVLNSINIVQAQGIDRLNIDLMYGLPGQTIERWKSSLQEAVDMGINCISFYSYIFMETPAAIIKSIQGKLPKMADNSLRKEMFYSAAKLLTGYGYEGYFADAFTKPGYQTAYAIGPWRQHLNVIGIGASAIGNIKGNWYINESDIDEYMKIVNNGCLPYSIGKKITKKDELRRSIILGIKLCDLNRKEYEKFYGVDFVNLFKEQIKILQDRGLIEITDESLKVTGPKGWYYLDNISKEFFEEEYKRHPQPADSSIFKMMKEISR